ncbi:Ig-like domain-containing protein [Flammeovirga agarivorans]|uniref:Carboxypeptidase regulatory-like domain-containing protein n=1 Tax=Flammeovirga agarivorans TaxID=2726742 RepID=A0A7X8SIW1_9BACT|nr:Ig-like domain-containing protein [Flammeovirga agarivorans]NLR91050.1 carboxypeptidase regulatory-like domain-containing protein [Flammeovirga agarivorans]
MKTTNKITLFLLFAIVMIGSSFSMIDNNTVTKLLVNPMLQVTVLDAKGNVVQGAEVTLYANEDDAWDEENGIPGKSKSNQNGRVKFTKGLKEQTYYIIAKKGNLVSEDGLKSSKLQKNKLNKVNVIIK